MDVSQASVINTLISLAIGLITLLGLLGGIWVGFYKKIKAFKARAADLLAAAEQLPTMISDHAGFKDEMQRISGMAQRVQSAVLPNGGNSIPDQLRVMSSQSEERGKQIDNIGKKVDSLGNTMRAAQNANSRVATFDTDEEGHCVYVNRTYLRWTGLPLSEVLGWGWLNAIHPEDRQRVRDSWDSAVADSRRFQDTYRIVHVDGAIFTVDGSAEPVPENVIPAERWVGQLTRSSDPT